MPRYLQRRYRTWYAVMEVPKPLRAKLGRSRFKQTLKTESLSEAERRALPLVAEWQRLVDEAKQDKHLNPATALLADARTQGELDHAKEDVLKLASFFRQGVYRKDEANAATVRFVEELADDMEEAAGARHPLMDYVAEYLATQSDIAPKSRDMKEADLRRFARKFRFAQDADRLSVIAWVENDLMGTEGLSAATCRRIISNCRGYWSYLERHKALKEPEPFKGVVPARRGPKKANTSKRRGFTPDDYKRLLSGCEGQDTTLRDLIMLGAHTGARIEELCGLTIDRVEDDRFVIEEAKTEAGHRIIPIHSAIIDRVHQLKETSSDGYLLNGLTFNKYRDRSNAIGKRFGRLKTAMGYSSSYVFHSFRKGVATQFEQRGIPENEAARLLGHEFYTMSYGLYSGGALPFERLKDVVESLQWSSDSNR